MEVRECFLLGGAKLRVSANRPAKRRVYRVLAALATIHGPVDAASRRVAGVIPGLCVGIKRRDAASTIAEP